MKNVIYLLQLLLTSAKQSPLFTCFLLVLGFLGFALYSAVCLAQDGTMVFLIYAVLTLCAFAILAIFLINLLGKKIQ